MPGTTESIKDGPQAVKTHVSQERSQDERAANKNEVKSASADPARTAALKARKRTKTGCLTCRKRRIKCGEERPTCKNCIKSKRDCEGYIPRVIFKDPLGAYRPGQHGIISRNAPPSIQNGAGHLYGSIPSASTTPIAPRLSSYADPGGFGPLPHGGVEGRPGESYGSANTFNYGAPTYSTNNGHVNDNFAPAHYATPSSDMPGSVYKNGVKRESFSNGQINTNPFPNFQQAHSREIDSAIELSPPSLPNGWSNASNSSSLPSAEFPVPFESPSLLNSNQPSLSDVKPERCIEYKERKPSLTSQAHPRTPVQDSINNHITGQNQVYDRTPWVTEPEDEYFDVDSEDDSHGIRSHHLDSSSYNLGPLIALSASHNHGGMRSMHNFLDEPNVLATYVPSYAASPLMDPHTARVFCHFITATAPTLQVCERHPSNPSIIFSGVPVPKSQRALWSYTMPMLALTHQGLLHAMLALGSLHIAKLQNTSPTPSLKHYHYALRRVAKALGNPKRRKNVATLAATLLLGFYEITTAEHNKWNSHLSGARELVMDIDFASMGKKIERHRRRQEETDVKSNFAMYSVQGNGFHHSYPNGASDEFPSRDERQLDENLVSTLMGWQLDYNQYGQVFDEYELPNHSEIPPTPKEIDSYEIQSDLFWWYAKQDMYQSLVSGNRLLLSYDRWSLCPPRAPVGRLDAVYGTLDHLLLLMGRMADFAGKDLPRKLRAQREAEIRAQHQAQSNNHTPYPSPPTPQGPPKMSNTSQPSSDPMYGYMPNPGSIRVPRGFDQAKLDQNYAAYIPMEGKSLEMATMEAEAEWGAISHAFDVFANSLRPAFAPLEPEHMTPVATPFGPALYYRSYSIACVLIMFYCGKIACQRIKPNMPPAAMAATGVAAQSTAQHANTIGRICAGIQPIDATISINPHHGAALMDCCMGLFQAGIQYRDPGQRGWTITKLRDIARLTGWQTSALIASGCERAWMRAAETGRGPPYTRTMNSEAKDDRVAGRGRDPKALEQPPKDNNDRRFITVNAGTRVYWALGLLGVEEDMKAMKLE